MSVFQKPPSSPKEYEQFVPLDIPPDEVLEMDEDEWYEKVYRGEDFPQLTLRAVVMGSVLGFFLAFTNLYIGLKTGWALGVAITACIVSYSMWTFFQARGWAKTPMTILENNCMQSTASAAGYSTGGTMVSAISALLLLSVTPDNPQGQHLPVWVLVSWTLFLAVLGTLIAIPMKRNMINRERLKFPSGTAAAVTLQSLYSTGSEALKKGRALLWSAVAGSVFPLLIDLKLIVKDRVVDPIENTVATIRGSILQSDFKIFDPFLSAPGLKEEAGKITTYKPSDWTMVWDTNPVMVAAGALVGLRVAIYMMIGGLVLVYALGWPGIQSKWTTPLGEQWNAMHAEVSADQQWETNLPDKLQAITAIYPKAQISRRQINDTLGLDQQLAVVYQAMRPGFTQTSILGDANRKAVVLKEIKRLHQAEVLGAVTAPNKAWKEIGLWLGVPIMLAYGLLQFFSQWRTIVRAIRGVRGDDSQVNPLMQQTEVPFSWFSIGTVISSVGVVWVANVAFGIPWMFGFLAVALSYLLALVACRATGESDITPVGAMGKLMQLTFGTIMPQSANANLMSASITANTAGSAADLLNDLKSGYLLGANPRRQFLAQMMGIAAGTLATVTGFYLLVPTASVIGSPDFPAPAAMAWKAVADLMTGGGIANMHPMHRVVVWWGLGIGAGCLALETLLPKWRTWLPSATGLGLGLILPFQYPLSMFVGALIAWAWAKKWKQNAHTYVVPIAAGLIAGIAIMGVLMAIFNLALSADPVAYPAERILTTGP